KLPRAPYTNLRRCTAGQNSATSTSSEAAAAPRARLRSVEPDMRGYRGRRGTAGFSRPAPALSAPREGGTVPQADGIARTADRPRARRAALRVRLGPVRAARAALPVRHRRRLHLVPLCAQPRARSRPPLQPGRGPTHRSGRSVSTVISTTLAGWAG